MESSGTEPVQEPASLQHRGAVKASPSSAHVSFMVTLTLLCLILTVKPPELLVASSVKNVMG